MSKLIGLSGLAGSGKSTIGNILRENGFKPLSFADSLKNSVSAIFGWDRKLLEGDTVESREFRLKIDTFWSNKLGRPITPRYILQYFGTDICRNNISENIWLNSLERKLEGDVVITDVRFKNEYDFIHEHGGIIVKVERYIPHWQQLAKDAELGDVDALKLLEEQGVHRSEWDLINCTPDYIIENTSTLENLKKETEKFIELIEE